MPGQKLPRPLVIFDGDCGFCRLWIERWKEIVGAGVDFAPSQEVGDRFPEIPSSAFEESVQLIEPDGSRYSHADAVFRLLAKAGGLRNIPFWCYRHIPGVAPVTDFGYGIVARYRTVFSFGTRFLWGNDVRRPQFAAGSWMYQRLLALVFLIAFASAWWQLPGLAGEEGILPAGDFFEMAETAIGAEAYWRLPTLNWLASGTGALQWTAAAGCLVSVLAMVGIATPVCFLILWALYLSICVSGQVFFGYQWDALLLEAGFLAIFLGPWKAIALGPSGSPLPVARFLSVWLLFRVMFLSGVVKLTSGDELWASLRALEVHYLTQPLPTPIAWHAEKLPVWFQKLSCAGMFGIELILPFFFFLPRNLRLIGAIGTLALQAGIALTGNYGFFNLLVSALCLLLIDDAIWRALLRRLGFRGSEASAAAPMNAVAKGGVALVALLYFLLSLPPIFEALGKRAPGFLATPSGWIAPFRTVNGYGLFAVMTPDRPEILLEGSMDGLIWKEYQFRFKPGPLDRAPPWAGPYMPRLDWQMWFAALGNFERTPWFHRFVRSLLEGSPEVTALLKEDPFPGGPPRFLRAKLDRYEFTTPEERATDGDWWTRESVGYYMPEVTLR